MPRTCCRMRPVAGAGAAGHSGLQWNVQRVWGGAICPLGSLRLRYLSPRIPTFHGIAQDFHAAMLPSPFITSLSCTVKEPYQPTLIDHVAWGGELSSPCTRLCQFLPVGLAQVTW
jgi:hypothetical protein